MDLLKSLCSIPTAPFVEHRVVEFVRDFVKQRKNLSIRKDRFGNLLIELKSRSKLPRWVFTGHKEQRGLIGKKVIDKDHLKATFQGWVKVEFIQNTRVRFFDEKGEATGIVTDTKVEDYDARAVPSEVTIKINRSI